MQATDDKEDDESLPPPPPQADTSKKVMVNKTLRILNPDQFSKDQYMLNIENSKHYGGGKPLPILNFQSIALQHHQVLLPLQLKTATLVVVFKRI